MAELYIESANKSSSGRKPSPSRARSATRQSDEAALADRLVAINRVSKTVKGGKRFGFAALVVVGDQKGRVGFGKGKAKEVPEAIRKATEQAKRSLVHVPLREGRTLHHDIEGRHGAGKVIMRTAPEGTGIIAGGPMRAVFEMLGVKDVVSKSIGSANPYNMIRATINGLAQEESPRIVAKRRGLKPNWTKRTQRELSTQKPSYKSNLRSGDDWVAQNLSRLDQFILGLDALPGSSLEQTFDEVTNFVLDLDKDKVIASKELRTEFRRLPDLIWRALLRNLTDSRTSELAAKCLVAVTFPNEFKDASEINSKKAVGCFERIMLKSKNEAFVSLSIDNSRDNLDVLATVWSDAPFKINGEKPKLAPRQEPFQKDKFSIVCNQAKHISIAPSKQVPSSALHGLRAKITKPEANPNSPIWVHFVHNGTALTSREIQSVKELVS